MLKVILVLAVLPFDSFVDLSDHFALDVFMFSPFFIMSTMQRDILTQTVEYFL